MTAFILIAALITVITLALLIWPLKRTRNTISYERHAQNIHFAKERLQELEAQLKNAVISATDYEALKLEIESTLAHDIDIANQAQKTQGDQPRRSNKFSISLLCLFVPLSAIGVYMITGSPESITPKVSSQPNAQQITDLITNVERRLAENPDDLQGWQILSQTYLALGRYGEAQKGYLRVLELGGESADTYASLADATGLKAGGQVTAQALKYALKALELNPNNRQALWLAGLGAMQKGEKVGARNYWGRLVPLLDSVPDQQQELREIIAQSIDEPPMLAKENSERSIADALTVSVSLDQSLASKASPNDFVFVFARAQNGPPAPLAVKRIRVSDLPLTLSLSDADSMIEQFKLSAFEDVLVSARVSKSGQPTAQAGDLQSAKVSSKNSNPETIELIISEVVE